MTSPGQPRFAALVIMASQRRLCAAASSPAAITNAGRRWRTGLSVYGNGTLTMSQASKPGIAEPIGLGRPLAERGERVVRRRFLHFGQDHPVALDSVGQLISRSEAKGRPHW